MDFASEATMSTGWLLPGTTAARLRSMPLWQRRLAMGIVISLILHGLAIFGLRAGGTGAQGTQTTMLLAHLVPAASTGDVAEADPAPLTATKASTTGTTPSDTEAGGKAAQNISPAAAGRSGAGALPLDLLQTKTYYLAARLHKAPVALEKFRFDYPTESTVRDGLVVARVLINERGSVDDVIIDRADPPGMFEANTVASLLRARFSPGELHRQPVPSQISVEVRYQNPEGTPGGMSITATGP